MIVWKSHIDLCGQHFDVVAVYLLPQEERLELIKDAFESALH